MLGIYDYTVVLTYVSLMVSIGGMMLSVNGHLNLAVLCLAISGLCDMFDGKIARTKKDRTEEEKCFGIQIDSLCDIVCFGVGPPDPRSRESPGTPHPPRRSRAPRTRRASPT